MARIRSRDTQPEQVARSLLHKLGFRFRLATGNRIYGRPDVVLPKYRTVVFVHGCFWHRHSLCRFAYTPKSRVDFWMRKFCANVARDAEVKSHLRREGWRVVVLWECELSKTGKVSSKLQRI